MEVNAQGPSITKIQSAVGATVFTLAFTAAVVIGTAVGSLWAFLLTLTFGSYFAKVASDRELARVNRAFDSVKVVIQQHARELSNRRCQLLVLQGNGMGDDSMWRKDVDAFIHVVLSPHVQPFDLGKIHGAVFDYIDVVSTSQSVRMEQAEQAGNIPEETSPGGYAHSCAKA